MATNALTALAQPAQATPKLLDQKTLLSAYGGGTAAAPFGNPALKGMTLSQMASVDPNAKAYQDYIHYTQPDTGGSWWNPIRNAVETAASLVGNYYLPGSSAITSNLVSKESQAQLNSPLGKLAQIGTGVTGGMSGNLANYGKGLNAVGLGNIGQTIGIPGAVSDAAAGAHTLADVAANTGLSEAEVTALSNAAPGLSPNALNTYASAGYTPDMLYTMAQNAPISQLESIASNSLSSSAAGGGSLLDKAKQLITGGGSSQQLSDTLNGSNSGGGILDNAIGTIGKGFQAAGGTNALLGALASGGASLYGANQASNAADQALAETRRQFDIGQANVQPWLSAGKTALGSQLDLMGLPGGTTGGSADQMAALQASPGYQFRLDQGRRGLDAGIAARGGMGSGKAATGVIDYNQNFASNEYGNRLNQLAGLSGTGQTQANQSFNQGMNYAGQVGTGTLAGAAARQSGIFGAGNALSNYLNPQPMNQSTIKWGTA